MDLTTITALSSPVRYGGIGNEPSQEFGETETLIARVPPSHLETLVMLDQAKVEEAILARFECRVALRPPKVEP